MHCALTHYRRRTSDTTSRTVHQICASAECAFMYCVCVLQLSLRLMFKTPLVSFYIYEYKGSAKAHIFPNVFFCSSPSCLDQACVPLYTLYCMQSCPSLQNLLHLQSEHTLRVYTSRLYISLYFDLHVCIAASDHEYIVSMHFIKLYKGEGNAPDVSDCCYETTGESVTKKKNVSPPTKTIK